MLNLEVDIFSREIIEPSSPEIHHRKPFKISIFDQLISTTYVTTNVLLLDRDTNFTITTVLTQLKRSLSETLNILYLFSDRIQDNMFVDHFDENISFLSTRVNCRLSEFLKHHEIESLNKLLPSQPFMKELNDEVLLMVCQATIFACGGIALGTSLNLANVWSTICRGSHRKVGYPNFSRGIRDLSTKESNATKILINDG